MLSKSLNILGNGFNQKTFTIGILLDFGNGLNVIFRRFVYLESFLGTLKLDWIKIRMLADKRVFDR